MIQTTYRKRIIDIPVQQYDEWNQLLNLIQPSIPRRWVTNTPYVLAGTIYVTVTKDAGSGHIINFNVYRREYLNGGLPLTLNQLKEFALRKLVLG